LWHTHPFSPNDEDEKSTEPNQHTHTQPQHVVHARSESSYPNAFPQHTTNYPPKITVRELLDFYEFPGDETPIIRGSALAAVEVWGDLYYERCYVDG
jgi:hypothetical protein